MLAQKLLHQGLGDVARATAKFKERVVAASLNSQQSSKQPGP